MAGKRVWLDSFPGCSARKDILLMCVYFTDAPDTGIELPPMPPIWPLVASVVALISTVDEPPLKDVSS